MKCDQLVAGCFLPWSRWLPTNGDKKKERKRKRRASSWQKARAHLVARGVRDERKKGRGGRRAVPLCESCFRSGPIQSTFSIGEQGTFNVATLCPRTRKLSPTEQVGQIVRASVGLVIPSPCLESLRFANRQRITGAKSWHLKLGIYSRLRGSLSTACTSKDKAGTLSSLDLVTGITKT